MGIIEILKSRETGKHYCGECRKEFDTPQEVAKHIRSEH